jgi:hypothetical protein
LVAGGEYMPDLSIPESDDCGGIAIWLSDDSTVWSRVPHDPDVFCAAGGASVGGIAVSGDTIVVVGESKRVDSPVVATVGTVWASQDRGASWHVISGPEDVFGDGSGFDGVEMRSIIELDGSFVAYGSYGGEAAIWIGSWNPDFGG